MRTTIRINEHLLSEAKKLAIENNASLSAPIETALKEMMGRRQQNGSKEPVQLPTFKGKGLKARPKGPKGQSLKAKAWREKKGVM